MSEPIKPNSSPFNLMRDNLEKGLFRVGHNVGGEPYACQMWVVWAKDEEEAKQRVRMTEGDSVQIDYVDEILFDKNGVAEV